MFAFAPSAAAVTFNEFPIPTPNGGPREIALGPDGALWFTEEHGDKTDTATVRVSR